jgi:hypothetical protein
MAGVLSQARAAEPDGRENPLFGASGRRCATVLDNEADALAARKTVDYFSSESKAAPRDTSCLLR